MKKKEEEEKKRGKRMGRRERTGMGRRERRRMGRKMRRNGGVAAATPSMISFTPSSSKSDHPMWS